MSRLPYHDTKSQGAPDFYFAINATFRFLLKHRGRKGWIRYLQEMGKSYFSPVNQQWKQGGLPEVAEYWKEFFQAEPGAEVEVEAQENQVSIEVKTCPAIRHLKNHQRDIVSCFCQHCYFLNQARAEEAGLSMTVEGGNGSCTHRYGKTGALQQDLALIKEVS